MAKKPMCLVCQKEMVIGRMMDPAGHHENVIPRWYPGELQTSQGLAPPLVPQPLHHGYTIVAYRCPECEALRLYAPSTTK